MSLDYADSTLVVGWRATGRDGLVCSLVDLVPLGRRVAHARGAARPAIPAAEHGQNEGAGDPAFARRVADRAGEEHAGDRLHYYRGCREDAVRYDDDAGNAGDDRRLLAEVRGQHQEGDAGTGAEEH